ncbi:MAG: MarR family winged helix-turn-helix transcriptional regulator, partial [Hyphomicrobium sp.]
MNILGSHWEKPLAEKQCDYEERFQMNAPVNLVSTSTTHLLHRAGQLAEDLFARSIGEIGITARQFVVLSVVDGLEDPSQTALCEISGIDRSTLADIVRRLVSRGLLSRRRTRQDARMYAVRITPEGKEVLQRALPIAAKVDESLVESLSPEQREEFSTYLQKVVSRQGPRE